MAITETDILRFYPDAARSEVILRAAVLDSAFDVILSEMHRQGLFELCGMVFKGGTALRKFHFGHKSRFSFDLDFDAEEGAADIVAEQLDGYSSHGFSFEFNERRMHHLLKVVSPLFADGFYEVKIDFSNRGCWLPPGERKPLSSPVRAGRVWDETAVVPTMRVEENVAEKLSRWQGRQLVRDLYDIAETTPSLTDLSLVAKLYVLKSHRNFLATLPSRRPACAARLLGPVAASVQPSDFELADLVQPQASTDRDKTTVIRDALNVVERLSQALDTHIDDSSLSEIAADTGTLDWRVDQEVQSLQEQHRQVPAAEPPPSAALGHELGLAFVSHPQVSRSVCGNWMPISKTRCVLTARHAPPCRSGGRRGVNTTRYLS